MGRFEISFLDFYTDDGLLDEIRRVATIHAGGPLTKKAFKRLSGRVAALRSNGGSEDGRKHWRKLGSAISMAVGRSVR